MEKFFFKIGIFLACILAPSFFSLLNYREPSLYATKDIARNLVVKHQDQIVGYIKGSIHYGFTEEELLEDKRDVNSILTKVSKVFLEAPLGHFTSLKNGLERITLEAVEKNSSGVEVSYLESSDSQIALIGSLYNVGNTLHYVPYGDLFIKSPGVAKVINQINSILNSIPALVYQNIINQNFRDELTVKNSKKMSELRQSFLSKKTGKFSNEFAEQFRIISRDREMYKKLKKEIDLLSTDNKFLLIIGSGHLATEKGILSLFKKDGYTIEEA